MPAATARFKGFDSIVPAAVPAAPQAMAPHAIRLPMIRPPNRNPASLCVLALGAALATGLRAATLGAAEPARFEARLADGSRIEGARLTDWQRSQSQPKLDGRPLFDAARPLVWLRDRRVEPAEAPEAFVEMIGGDRLPGVVMGYCPAGVWDRRAMPAHLLVKPAIPVAMPKDPAVEVLRVDLRFVRRIVWLPADQRERGDRAARLVCRDGRLLELRSVRFKPQAVYVLGQSGLAEIPFTEIAELDLPQVDPWEAYRDELAMLALEGDDRLLQLETATGLRLTGSLAHLLAAYEDDANDCDRWWHGLRPAWAEDVIWVPLATVVFHRSFPPHQVPLSRVLPVKADHQPVFARDVPPWRIDRRAQAEPLRSGGREFAWGLGVWAPSRLEFPLPAEARAFRTQMGLDRRAGDGGCVRAAIHVGSTAEKPLYESPLLVGSAQTCDSARLALAESGDQGRRLVLRVEAEPADRPAGADPFDIRDMFDWLEPVVELDPELLSAAVEQRRLKSLAAWQGWQIEPGSDGSPHAKARFDRFWPPRGRHHCTVLAETEPFRLRRSLLLGSRDIWLHASAFVYHAYSARPKLRLYVDGRLVGEKTIPVRDGGHRALQGVVFPLLAYQGRRVEVELEQTPGDRRLDVWWNALEAVEHLPELRCLFEEVPPGAAGLADERGVAQVETHYTGRTGLRLAAGGRVHLGPFDPPLEIEQNPSLGQFRYLRLAVRKQGGGCVWVELSDAAQPDERLGLVIGKGPPPFAKASRRHNEELADQWLALTLDLGNDAKFRGRRIRDIVLRAPDGQSAWFDHIYCSQWEHHLAPLRSLVEEQPAEQ